MAAAPGLASDLVARALQSLLRPRTAIHARSSVIAVPGVFTRPHQTLLLHAYLSRRCGYHVVPVHYDGLNSTIDATAEQLAELLAQHKQHTGDVAVHFVTHGVGALVLRRAFRFLDWTNEGTRIVMLAPPNRGSVLARNARQTAWGRWLYATDRGMMRELSTQPPEHFSELGDPPQCSRVLIIVGRCTTVRLNPFLQQAATDGWLLDSETMLDTPHLRIRAHLPHNLLLYHPATMRAIAAFLDGRTESLLKEHDDVTSGDEPFHPPGIGRSGAEPSQPGRDQHPGGSLPWNPTPKRYKPLQPSRPRAPTPSSPSSTSTSSSSADFLPFSPKAAELHIHSPLLAHPAVAPWQVVDSTPWALRV